ncbi:MAG: hypothetical protein ACHP7O_08445 [Burkholderiales bacterium]
MGKMIRFLLLAPAMVLLALSAAGQDASVLDTKKNARKSTGEESRVQKSQQNAAKKSITVSSEVGVSTLFLSILQEKEKSGQLYMRDSLGGQTKCSVFDANFAVYSITDAGTKVTTSLRDGKQTTEFRDGGAYTTIKATHLIGGPEADRLLGRAVLANTRLACLVLYSDFVDSAARILLAEKMDVATNAYGENVFIVPDLASKAREIFIHATDKSFDVLDYKCQISAVRRHTFSA